MLSTGATAAPLYGWRRGCRWVANGLEAMVPAGYHPTIQYGRIAAGIEFQFRDLRAKAASDADDLAHAQKLLGHKTRGMTEHYTRERIGESVNPLNSGIVEDRSEIVEKRVPAKSSKPA